MPPRTSPLPEEPPVHCALEAIYSWSYEPEVEELRTLYANALERQWIAARDVDWERSIDPADTLAALDDPQQFFVGSLHVWRELPEERQRAIAAKLEAFMLSQFLHGEQGALMVAAQLVKAVPHMDGKFYAAAQTLDEARHTGYGIKYLGHVVPTLAEAERAELEDFAFEATRRMMGQRGGGFGRKMLEIFASEGVDVGRGLAEILERREELRRILVDARRRQGFDADPLRGFVLPTLANLGLLRDRIAPRYRQLVEENLLSGFEGTTFGGSLALPDDLEAWVDETGGA
jgi:hypothetical protein